MRFSTLITGASLLGLAAAAPAVHQHKDKRDVVTETVRAQVTVVVGGNAPNTSSPAAVTTEAATTSAAAATEAATTAAATTSAAATSEAATTAAATTSVASSGSASSAVASSSASSGSSSGSSSSSGSAGVKGITYTPYTSSGACKSASEVASDMAELSAYPIIRLYGVDCDQVANVLQGKSSSQKLFLGIYYVDQIQAGIDTMSSAISQYGSWSDVVTVSIGNELVNGGEASVAQVGQYVSTGRSALTAAGYSGDVVSVDTFIAIINNPGLCSYSDYMAINAHAYFDQNTVAADAGTWLLEQIQRVSEACSGAKSVVVTESGWPSQGDTYGVAVPSKANQKSAIASITSSCGSDTYLFNAFNDLWKADGPYGVEKYWGILSS